MMYQGMNTNSGRAVEDIRVTMRYAHFAPDHLEEAITLNPLTQTYKDSGGKVATEEEKGCNAVEQEA